MSAVTTKNGKRNYKYIQNSNEEISYPGISGQQKLKNDRLFELTKSHNNGLIDSSTLD